MTKAELVKIISDATGILITDTAILATPTLDPPGGTYDTEVFVEILCATEDATIRYTTDGTDPTELSPGYSVPIEISKRLRSKPEHIRMAG